MNAFTVALVGADGAGKSTIGRRLAASLPLPVRYLYMGDNPEATTRTLPVRRWLRGLRRTRGTPPRHHGPPDPGRLPRRPTGAWGRLAAPLKAVLRLVNRLAEEWYRQALAWQYQRRGYIVVFDRHFFADYYAHHVAPAAPGVTLSNRIHGIFLNRLYPKPDLVICLDAPADVLFARKPEGTIEALERRRQEYFQIRHRVGHFTVVDASQPVDDVAHAVATLVEEFYWSRVRRGQAAGGAP